MQAGISIIQILVNRENAKRWEFQTLIVKNWEWSGIFNIFDIFRPVFTAKTSLAGLPSTIPSRPLKENKYKVVPNYIRKSKKNFDNDDDDEENYEEKPKAKCFVKPNFKPQKVQVEQEEAEEKPNPFKTASRQLALNVAKKNGNQGYQRNSRPGGIWRYFCLLY